MTTRQKQLNQEIRKYRRLKNSATDKDVQIIYDKYIEATKVEMRDQSTVFKR